MVWVSKFVRENRGRHDSSSHLQRYSCFQRFELNALENGERFEQDGGQEPRMIKL